MAKEITMPKLSDTMEEGKVLRWLKREGETIERGDVIAEVETDKADMEMEAFDSGTLLAIKVKAGETAAVGDVIGYIGGEGERLEGSGVEPARAEARAPGNGGEATPAEGESALSGDGDRTRGAATVGRRSRPQRGEVVARDSGAAENADIPGAHADIAEIIEPDVEEEAEGEEGSSRQAPAGAPSTASPRSTKGITDHLPFRAAKEERRGRPKITPVARRLAAEVGLDVSELEGSGPEGRIVRRDVESAMQRAAASAPPRKVTSRPAGAAATAAAGVKPAVSGARAVAPGASQAAPETQPAAREARPAARETRPAAPDAGPAAPQPLPVPVTRGELGTTLPHSKIRRAIASRMAESKRTVPHFYTTVAARMDEALKLKSALALRDPDLGVGVTHLIVKACALALERFPRVNAVFEEERIRIPAEINVGLAVAVEDGLIVPVIHDCAAKSLQEITREARALVSRVKAGKLGQDDLHGATFSVSNMGIFEIEQFAAIIVPPQSAILAVGGTADEAVVADGRVVPGKVMRMTLSADHRAIDGVLAAAFLVEVRRFLENPLSLVI